MVPLRCILAEWQLVRARVVRSRLGVWLLLLGAGFAWLGGVGGGRGVGADLAPVVLRVGMLGAILCVAFCAGGDADRTSLALTLTHPTTPAAVALGRWLAALTAASVPMLACTAVVATQRGATGTDAVAAALAGLSASGAVAACTLLAVWVGGNALAGVLFVYVAVLSAVQPAALRGLFASGPLRSIGVGILEVAPSLWRYRRLAAGEWSAWVHALAWVVAGVWLASVVARRRFR